MNPDGTIAFEVGLRASDNNIHLVLTALKSATDSEADIEVVREINGKAEVVSTMKATFRTGHPTGIADVFGAEAKVYYVDGILHLVNLEGYDCSVVAISGQRLNVFRVISSEET